MTSSSEPQESEMVFGSPHGDYRITVGYSHPHGGYYVTIHHGPTYRWNTVIYEYMDKLKFTDAFDHVRVNSLEEALGVSLLDNSLESQGPLAFGDVQIILGMISDADPIDIEGVRQLAERIH